MYYFKSSPEDLSWSENYLEQRSGIKKTGTITQSGNNCSHTESAAARLTAILAVLPLFIADESRFFEADD